MRNALYLLIGIVAIASLSSCVDEFLAKPIGSDTTVDAIFSSRESAQATVAQAYSQSLLSGLPGQGTWDGFFQTFRESTISMISGEVNAAYQSWQDAYKIERGGMAANDGTGRLLSEDGFPFNYVAIRHNYLVMENIDNVPGMTDTEKKQIKAEMKALSAYRYGEMLKRYGGVPIIKKSLSLADSIMIPRATIQQTVDWIVQLCDEAAPDLPGKWEANWTGRMTRGAALAVKAEALIYAARPLFNSASPYLDLGPDNNLISYGNYDPQRWERAAIANEEVLQWASQNGHHIINTGSPLDDYGTAVSVPSNAEVLLAYKNNFSNGASHTTLFHPIRGGYQSAHNHMSYTQLTQYYKQDGSDQTWAGDDPEAYEVYVTKMQEMEARYKASAKAAGINPWNNPGCNYWSNTGSWNNDAQREGSGKRVKFWYKNCNARNWFEYPIYRLAETYLNLAEAYNELGQTGRSVEKLNVIRNRAGLPGITPSVSQADLRRIIQREWAIEFYEEGHRLFDVKHWKLDDIDKGILGGPKKQFRYQYVEGRTNGFLPDHYVSYRNAQVYNAYWHPKLYLHPFPTAEINKGYLVQNPGY